MGRFLGLLAGSHFSGRFSSGSPLAQPRTFPFTESAPAGSRNCGGLNLSLCSYVPKVSAHAVCTVNLSVKAGVCFTTLDGTPSGTWSHLQNRNTENPWRGNEISYMIICGTIGRQFVVVVVNSKLKQLKALAYLSPGSVTTLGRWSQVTAGAYWPTLITLTPPLVPWCFLSVASSCECSDSTGHLGTRKFWWTLKSSALRGWALKHWGLWIGPSSWTIVTILPLDNTVENENR